MTRQTRCEFQSSIGPSNGNEVTVQQVSFDDATWESAASGLAPHVHIGRLLAQKYDHLVHDPLPGAMLCLLVQIQYRELRDENQAADPGE